MAATQPTGSQCSFTSKACESRKAELYLQNRPSLNTPRPDLTQLTTQPASAPDAGILQSATLSRELPALYQNVLALYARASQQRIALNGQTDGSASMFASPSIAGDGSGPIHPLLYIEACFRCARMELALLLRNSVWDTQTVSLLMGLQSAKWPSPTYLELFKLSNDSSTSRFDIASTLYLAYSPLSNQQLQPRARIRFLSSIAGMYAYLHFPRKRAIVLRELAAVAAYAASLESNRLQEGVTGLDEKSNETFDSKELTSVKSAPDVIGSEAIIRLIQLACEAFGVPVIPPAEIIRSEDESELGQKKFLQSEVTISSGTGRFRFGWPELQVALVKDAIAISETLADYQGAIRFTITALRELAEAIPPRDQYKLSQSIPRLFAASSRRGSKFEMAYWGPPDLLMSIEIAS